MLNQKQLFLVCCVALVALVPLIGIEFVENEQWKDLRRFLLTGLCVIGFVGVMGASIWCAEKLFGKRATNKIVGPIIALVLLGGVFLIFAILAGH